MFGFKTPSFIIFDQEPEEGIQREAKDEEAESEEDSEALCLGTKENQSFRQIIYLPFCTCYGRKMG